MENKYTTLDYCIGDNLKEVIFDLWKHQMKGELASTEFNGHMLYSDEVSLNGTYKEVTGRTFFEAQEAEKAWRENYDREEREHKEKIPQLTLEWIETGRDILDKKYWELWDKIVPIRLGDLYHGMELGNCLDIILKLNDDCSLEEAEAIIDGQGHSGMSYGLVREMVREFCDRGEEFANYIR